jgi:predicted histidine transporter YuiF (NhaC family)
MITRLFITQALVFVLIATVIFTVPGDFNKDVCTSINEDILHSDNSEGDCNNWDFKMIFIYLAIISLLIASVFAYKKKERIYKNMFCLI